MRWRCIPGKWLAPAVALILILCAGSALAIPESGPSVPPHFRVAPPPYISAGGALLMDWRTGEVLYTKDADRRRDPASTTKILTAIIAIEKGDLKALVKISPRAAGTIGSRMHIRAGEVYSLHDLLYGLLLRSGNDAAVAIAEHIGGSVEQFAEIMNAKAKAIGAADSHFQNPHGLTQPDHYTTAHDLALIARYALLNETFADIVATREIPLTYEQMDRRVVLYNTNRLLTMLEGADGVKTGTTAAAGRCLVASATRDEQKLVAVVLNAGNRWGDSQRLLEWGFGQFRLVYMGQKGERIRWLAVRDGKQPVVPLVLTADLPVVLPRSGPGLPVEVTGPDVVRAPVRKGRRLGKVTVRRNGQIVAEAELIAGQTVAEATLFDHMVQGMRPLLQWLTRGKMF